MVRILKLVSDKCSNKSSDKTQRERQHTGTVGGCVKTEPFRACVFITIWKQRFQALLAVATFRCSILYDSYVLNHFNFSQTWYEKAGSDVEVQSQSEHVVSAVHPGDLEQLEQRALALLLALINNGVITAQHHGVSSSLVGLR